MAIIHPLRPRVTGRVIIAVFIIWFASTLLAVPNLIYSTVFTLNNTDIHICAIEWPDGDPTVSKLDFW